jgi:hypothetical protein
VYRAVAALLLRKIYKHIVTPGRHLVMDPWHKPSDEEEEEEEEEGGAYSRYRGRNDVEETDSRRLHQSGYEGYGGYGGYEGYEPVSEAEQDNDDGEELYLLRENAAGKLLRVAAPSPAIPEYIKEAFDGE